MDVTPRCSWISPACSEMLSDSQDAWLHDMAGTWHRYVRTCILTSLSMCLNSVQRQRCHHTDSGVTCISLSLCDVCACCYNQQYATLLLYAQRLWQCVNATRSSDNNYSICEVGHRLQTGVTGYHFCHMFLTPGLSLGCVQVLVV